MNGIEEHGRKKIRPSFKGHDIVGPKLSFFQPYKFDDLIICPYNSKLVL